MHGFTLIELLVVIAIIGLLGTIIAGPINNARNKGKDAKKVADLKQIHKALQLYGSDNGGFPGSLSLLAPQYLNVLPDNALSTYTPQGDKYVYVTYQDSSGVIAGYHLGVKLRVSGNQALDTDSDCTQRGTTIDCMPFTVTGAGTINTTYTSNQDPGSPGAATGAAADFAIGSLPDSSTSTCAASSSTCVYDLAGQL